MNFWKIIRNLRLFSLYAFVRAFRFIFAFVSRLYIQMNKYLCHFRNLPEFITPLPCLSRLICLYPAFFLCTYFDSLLCSRILLLQKVAIVNFPPKHNIILHVTKFSTRPNIYTLSFYFFSYYIFSRISLYLCKREIGSVKSTFYGEN